MQNRASEREPLLAWVHHLGKLLSQPMQPSAGTTPVFMAALPVPPALVPVEQEEEERAGAEGAAAPTAVEPKVFRFR